MHFSACPVKLLLCAGAFGKSDVVIVFLQLGSPLRDSMAAELASVCAAVSLFHECKSKINFLVGCTKSHVHSVCVHHEPGVHLGCVHV